MLIVNRSTQPMDMPIDECGGRRPKPKGLSFSIETPPGDSPQPLLTTLEVSKQIAPNSTVVFTCAANKTSSDLQTVTVNIAGEENKQPRLVGSLPELGGWNPNDGFKSVWTGEHWSAKSTVGLHPGTQSLSVQTGIPNQ